jgi:SNF2 family DNA or RNA helicase
MGKVKLKKGSDWASIEVEVQDAPPGLAAELDQLLISNGGEPRAGLHIVQEHVLRACAGELAVLLRKYAATPEYCDAHTEQLFKSHLEEVRSRKSATTDSKIPEHEIVGTLRSSHFKRKLTEAQLRNITHLLFLRHGANFSVPGAGKTATLLAIYEILRQQDKLDRLLVIAPKNAFLAWEDEITLCFGEDRPSVHRLTGGITGVASALAEDPEVCLITYQLLPNVQRDVAEWAHRHRTHIVLDEAHRIKAGGGITAKAALMLSGMGVRRDILTGTPLPQSPEDLRPQLEFLWPGQRILPEYRLDSQSSDQDIAEVQRRVEPLYVRTTKKDLHLPPLKLNIVPVELGPMQREFYELLRSEAKRKASEMPSGDRAYLRSLGRHVVRLLQAASNPILLTQDAWAEDAGGEDMPSPDLKVRAFDLIREFARHEKPAKVMKTIEITRAALSRDSKAKVLIWTSFIRNIFYLEKLLAEYKPVSIYGAIGTGNDDDPDTREGRIRQFHSDPACRVMVANPMACGEGISLHQTCHHAIYLDRTFNAAHYLQSIDRIHRLGLPQDQITNIDILDAKWTIDTRLAKRLETKIKAMSIILNDPGLMALAYDPEDVAETEQFPGGLQPEDVEEVVEHLIRGEKGTNR